MKRIFKGKPVMLIYEGKAVYKQLKKCKIDVNDLLSMLREKVFFDISKVAYAVFEPSGKLSVLPKGKFRPPVLDDIAPQKAQPATLMNVLIVDGNISKSGLNEIDKSKEWLFKKLKIRNKKELQNIILATYDAKEKIFNIHYKKEN